MALVTGLLSGSPISASIQVGHLERKFLLLSWLFSTVKAETKKKRINTIETIETTFVDLKANILNPTLYFFHFDTIYYSFGYVNT
ncbi:MAG: hypothetical protein C0392_10655 [Syntrophus sp. (in: bacteria)]|nr:hypothetical protein [Syntrophus sp. (in: bacteria)]